MFKIGVKVDDAAPNVLVSKVSKDGGIEEVKTYINFHWNPHGGKNGVELEPGVPADWAAWEMKVTGAANKRFGEQMNEYLKHNYDFAKSTHDVKVTMLVAKDGSIKLSLADTKEQRVLSSDGRSATQGDDAALGIAQEAVMNLKRYERSNWTFPKEKK